MTRDYDQEYMLDLLRQAWGKYPSFTLGEFVHLAATESGAENSWDAGFGAMEASLKKIIESSEVKK